MKPFIYSILIAVMLLGGCATQEDSNLSRIKKAVAEQNAMLAQYDTPISKRVNQEY